MEIENQNVEDAVNVDVEPKGVEPKEVEKTTDETNTEPEKKYSDSDLNNIIAKQKSKWEAEKEKAVTEAKQLEKMNAEEKIQFELEKRQEELEAREAELSRRELQATAKDELANRGLPFELAGILDYTDATTVSESMKNVEKVFRSAVADEVNRKLKGTPPTTGGTPKETTVWDNLAGQYKKKQ